MHYSVKAFVLISLLLLFKWHYVLAQKESNIWYFGDQAGLDFNSGAPVAITNGKMNANEGCASISDNNGKLLFYTDGVYVYNRNHSLMLNNVKLNGNGSSTQSAIIVPLPGDSNKYFIFTVANEGKGGLCYSLVDMTENDGLGGVTVINKTLETRVCEKLSAVKHMNKKHFWVFSHLWESNKFVSYLITENGVQAPVYSAVGVYYGGDPSFAIGQLKVSPDGRRIASVQSKSNAECQVLDFDNSTGKISNPIILDKITYGYGVEFSLNGKLLYVSSRWEIYQYNLDISNSKTINDKRIKIKDSLKGLGSFQLGPDKKIYIAPYTSEYIHTIEKPDSIGVSCEFKLNSTSLGKKTARMGLPAFIQSYLYLNLNLSYTNQCFGRPTYFNGACYPVPDKWEWDFGDTISGSRNFSSLKAPSHNFSSPGKYSLKLKVTSLGITDSIEEEITIYNIPAASAGPDTLLCYNQSYEMQGKGGISYKWIPAKYLSNDTIANPIAIATDTQLYVLIVKNAFGCADTSQMWLKVKPKLEVKIQTQMQSVCSGEIVQLKASAKGGNQPTYQFAWENFSAKDSILNIQLKQSQWIKITLEDGCSEPAKDSIFITVKPTPISAFLTNPLDSAIEGNEVQFINQSIFSNNYIWIFGNGEASNSENPTYTYSDTGKYNIQLIASNTNGCSDTAFGNIYIGVKFRIYIPNAFTPDGDLVNDVFSVYGTGIRDYSYEIYNRWGQRIFTSTSIQKTWNGAVENKGETVQMDVYFYVLKVRDTENRMHYLNGRVNLIR